MVKAMVFPVVMYRCESWTIKKAEHQRIDAFELWCFSEKTLQSLLDSKEIKSVNPKGNQSWIFIGSSDNEVEALILWPVMQSGFIEKDPDPGKDWRQKEKGVAEDELGSSTNSMDMNLSELKEIVEDTGAGHAVVHGVANSQTWLSNWTTNSTTYVDVFPSLGSSCMFRQKTVSGAKLLKFNNYPITPLETLSKWLVFLSVKWK